MSYIEATDTSLRKTGQIKLHGPGGFAGMRKAGALVAKCLDELTDLVKVRKQMTEERDRLVGDGDMAFETFHLPGHAIEPPRQRSLQPVSAVRRQMRGERRLHH